MDRSDSPATFGHLSRFRFGFPTCVDLLKIGQELFGASQVPEASLVTCHSLRTPAAFHDLADSGRFLLTSRPLKRSSTATSSISGLYQQFRECGLPYGLQPSLCTLHLFCSRPFADWHPRRRSATGATRDTGGWLALSRQGLAPCKMLQASLGAITFELTCRRAKRGNLAGGQTVKWSDLLYHFYFHLL